MTNTMMLTKALLPIHEIAEKLGLLPEEYETIGTYGAKLKLGLLDNPSFPVRGKFILVTATTPTTSGEGKTVVSIGLRRGWNGLGASDCDFARAIAGAGVWPQRRRGGRRVVAGGAEPADQSAFSWRFSRDYRGTQYAGGDGGLAPLFWKRAGPRSSADYVAAGDGHERPRAAAG